MNGSSSPEETHEFLLLVNNEANQFIVHSLMDEYLADHTFSKGLGTDQKKHILEHIFQKEESTPKRLLLFTWKRLIVAAAVFLVLSSSLFFILKEEKRVVYSKYHGELKPGGNKATLTLADGTTLSLTNSTNGKLAEQAGVSIKKTMDGQLLYEIKGDSSKPQAYKNIAVQYNTVSTPTGGQYQVILPDGTHVWLNAASSLKFPVSFVNLKERRVELKGEAYFEVSKVRNNSIKIPFIVSSKGQNVEVLGTHFNVKNYPDEKTATTTLLEGVVKVSRPSAFAQILLPGDQAQVDEGIKVVQIDTSIAVAWKNGLFKFEDATIYAVMSQFSRWYDVDVIYEGKMPSNMFTGEIYRNMDASRALKILSYARINFRVEAPDNPKSRKKIVITSN